MRMFTIILLTISFAMVIASELEVNHGFLKKLNNVDCSGASSLIGSFLEANMESIFKGSKWQILSMSENNIFIKSLKASQEKIQDCVIQYGTNTKYGNFIQALVEITQLSGYVDYYKDRIEMHSPPVHVAESYTNVIEALKEKAINKNIESHQEKAIRSYSKEFCEKNEQNKQICINEKKFKAKQFKLCRLQYVQISDKVVSQLKVLLLIKDKNISSTKFVELYRYLGISINKLDECSLIDLNYNDDKMPDFHSLGTNMRVQKLHIGTVIKSLGASIYHTVFYNRNIWRKYAEEFIGKYE